MSTPYPRLSGPLGGAHPAVLARRVSDTLPILLTGLLAVAAAIALAVEVPHPSPLLALAIALGALGLLALMLSARYGLTLALLALYLGLLDGPVKLLSASQAASAVRDVLIFAIVLGMAARAAVTRERVRMPPLSGWVVAFVALVLIEAANPATHGILKVVGGFRQQLEWVPFFFFGYLAMRSKERLRKLFVLLGVIALANGAVGAYQAQLTPTQLASWGPGYGERIAGTDGLGGRTYAVEGVGRPRPPALGSDSGFGGGVGVLALPGLLAVLAVGGMRRRWLLVLLCLGALLGIATSASRTSVIIAVVALLSFGGLSLSAGRRAIRPLAALAAAVALAFAVGAVLVATEGGGVFARYESLVSSQAHGPGNDSKERDLAQIPRYLASAPFGVGLGTYGSAAGFGGRERVTIEGKGVTGESAYNLLALELGLPGLLLWVGLSLSVIGLAVRGLARVRDIELRVYLAAAFAVFIAFTVQGLSGPTLAVTPAGAYLWFAAGIAAYWFAGPGRAESALARGASDSAIAAGAR
jgi:hypothetical protein